MISSIKNVITWQLFAIVLTLCIGIPSVPADDSPFRILKSASELDYPPFALVLSDGSTDGFSVELLKVVVHTVGLEIDMPAGPWHEIKQKLTDGKLDVLPLVAYAPERDKYFDFTVPYLRMHGAIFVRKGETTIHSAADLKDKEVLVMRDDAAHEYAKKANLSNKLILTISFAEAMKLLSEGKHDAVVVQQLVGLQLLKKLGISNVVSLSSPLGMSLKPTAGSLSGFEQKFCFAVKEGDTELLALLNEGLSIIIANGTYGNLYNKWFTPILPPQPVSLRVIVKYLLLILGPIVFLLALGGVWYLNREVKQQTKHLNDEKIKAQRYLDITASIIVVLDDKGKVNLLNKKGCNFFGYNTGEAIGKDWFASFIPENEKAMVKEGFNKLISGEGGAVEYFENFVLAKGNKKKIVAWNNNAIRDEAGNIIGTISSGFDITDRKKAEEALQKAQDALEKRVEERTASLMKANDLLKLKQKGLESLINLYGMDAPTKKISNYVLEQAVTLSQSKIGFLGFIDSDERNMNLHAWSKDVMKECKITEKSMLLPIDNAGLWGEVVRHRKPLLINNYSKSNSYKKSLPDGHLNLDQLLVVPMVDKGRVVTIIAVGNKEEKYDKSDQHQLSLLQEGLWTFLTKGKREKELEDSTNNLKELNTALKVLLKQREGDKATIEENVLNNINKLVDPYLEKLKIGCRDTKLKTFIGIIEFYLKEIVSQFSRNLSSINFNLTPVEIQISGLIRQGQSTKEISELLNISARTVEFHRKNIRKKFALKNTKTNLRSYLASLD